MSCFESPSLLQLSVGLLRWMAGWHSFIAKYARLDTDKVFSGAAKNTLRFHSMLSRDPLVSGFVISPDPFTTSTAAATVWLVQL
ncbi:uncharacterized protein K452DRAFT_293269 [Aplosporella prunicola CBS 121167]|uniref:Uncharacterized protein n=1 Tax=Aplosporella prunicola CBS 121167 TaxID=1176127 RepID=A0A6A6ATN4_9PEZI|nr:uncharacterized protein K452DRAFT_293269 [Aplosporella prunicola CBS 121167]KAF2135382.1 hypothetical protein K452DRAFT_293269 [Aplosporella prunicola CBS 121167]